MDAAVLNAMAQRDELAAEINKKMEEVSFLKSEIVRVDRFIEQWHEFAGTQNELRTEGHHRDDTETHRRNRVTGNPKKEDVARAARAIIREAGEPVSRSDMYVRLAQRGLLIQGADPEKTLSTMLWRMRGLVARLPSGGYWLQEVPNAVYNYIPERDGTDLAQLLSADADAVPKPGDDDYEGEGDVASIFR